MTILLNGERYELAAPLTVAELLAHLAIDARRVAVEHNLVVVKRAELGQTVVREGDAVEIVNFVGGGQGTGQESWTASGLRTRPSRHG